MITNLTKTAEAITRWIEDKVQEAGAKATVAGLSGGADSALVALLCKDAKVPYIGVLMPCHSSESSKLRAMELVNKFKLNALEVDLTKAFHSIADQVDTLYTGTPKGALSVNKPSNASQGALRSCLRAPTLDYVSKLVGGLIVGTGNRDEDEMTRYFQKRGDGCVDISPIARLHKSEVYQLLAHMGCPESIIKATPTADLWGPDAGQEDEKELGLKYTDVEWGIRELNDTVDRYDGSPLDYKDNYSPGELSILMKLVAMEASSRHKAQPPPVFDVRAIPGLVR